MPFWGVEMCQIWGVEMCLDEVNYSLPVFEETISISPVQWRLVGFEVRVEGWAAA